MLDRVFGDTRIEELSRSLYCASVDLRDEQPEDRPPRPARRGGRREHRVAADRPAGAARESLLVDGSLLDNLPLAPMSASGEGPVLAIDIKSGEERARGAGGATDARQAGRTATAAADRHDGADRAAQQREHRRGGAPARRHDDQGPLVGVGMLEFHQIDEARAAGRRAAERGAPGRPAVAARAGAEQWRDRSGRRTVLRV